MKVKVKDLSATIELKQNGIELEIRDTQDNFVGDLVITSTNIIWCNGRTTRAKGKKISIPDFILAMNAGLKKPAKNAAAAPAVAAKAVPKIAPAKPAKAPKAVKAPKAKKVK